MAKNSTPKSNGVSPDADAADKMDAVRMAMDQIEKKYGRGSIMRFGEAAQKLDISVISTGCLPLDIALGVGGLPRGRIIEIYGPEASGKTTICLSVIAQAQKHGGVAAFIDAEHALDPIWAEKVGIKLDELLISQPDTGEQALEITESLVRSGGIDVLVIDSVAALVPRAEIEGEMGDSMMGLQARLMSQALRKLTAVISKSEAFYRYGEEMLGQGRAASMDTLRSNSEMEKKIVAEIMSKTKNQTKTPITVGVEDTGEETASAPLS